MEPIARGLLTGLNIGLLGIALWIVYAASRVLHLGLAAVYVVPPFLVFGSLRAGLPVPIAVATALLVGGGLSVACELFNHGPLSKRRASSSVHLASALGLYIVLTQVVVLIGGTETRQLR